MGLEEVIAEIIAKANSDAEAIIKEGRAKSQEILKSAEKEIAAKKSTASGDIEIVRSASSTRELADAELFCKRHIQDAKKELLDAAYSGLKNKLSAMGERERMKLLEKLLERSASELGKIGTVYVSGQDARIASALFRAKKIILKEKNISGGLIAESADGKIFLDYSFDTAIDSMKEGSIKELSRILF